MLPGNGLYVGIQAIVQPLIVQLQSEGGISLFLFAKFTVSPMGKHIVTPFSKVHQFRDD